MTGIAPWLSANNPTGVLNGRRLSSRQQQVLR